MEDILWLVIIKIMNVKRMRGKGRGERRGKRRGRRGEGRRGRKKEGGEERRRGRKVYILFAAS